MFQGFEPGEVPFERLGSDLGDDNDELEGDDDTSSRNRRGLPTDFEYDFDIMMKKRKDETQRRYDYYKLLINTSGCIVWKIFLLYSFPCLNSCA